MQSHSNIKLKEETWIQSESSLAQTQKVFITKWHDTKKVLTCSSYHDRVLATEHVSSHVAPQRGEEEGRVTEATEAVG